MPNAPAPTDAPAPEAGVEDPEPATVTVPGVELVRAGTWPAVRGDGTITEDDLDSMVAAASDPEVPPAVLRIGHRDPRFDGEPALGRLTNVRRAGDRVVADLAGVPRRLAQVMRDAFPSRSIEAATIATPSGRTYRRALTGLALLGVAQPAVRGLADVLSWYGANDQAEPDTQLVLDGPVHLSVNVDDLRRIYRETGPGGWPVEVYLDHLIVRDDADEERTIRGGDGSLWWVPFAVRPDDTVEWGEAVEVRQVYVPVADAAQLAADASVTLTDSAEGDGYSPTANGTAGRHAGTTPEDDTVPTPTIEDRLRELRGIEDDEQLGREVRSLLDSDPDDGEGAGDEGEGAEGAEQDGDGQDGEGAGEGEGAEASTREPVAASAADVPDGYVLLSADELAEIRAGAQAGATAATELAGRRASDAVEQAVRAGKIRRADVGYWSERAQRDLDDTVEILDRMPAVYPVTELGADHAPDADSADADRAADAALFPEIANDAAAGR